MRKRSGIDAALSTSRWGTGGRPTPRADWATKDSPMTEARARFVARLVVVDVDQLAEAPLRGQARHRALQVDARVPRADQQRPRLGGGQARAGGSVDQQGPHLPPQGGAGGG